LPENASHNAAADVEACRAIYYAITDAVAPVNRFVGDVRSMRAASLRRALGPDIELHRQRT
jgi:hypothetical protein